jgi:plastocyanin
LRRFRLVALTVLVPALLAGVLFASTGSAAVRHHARAGLVTTRVTVNMTEYHFALSRNSAPRGLVIFTVINKGTIKHDFYIVGKKTPYMDAGQKAVLKIVFKRKGSYQYTCTVGEHAIHGMFGHFRIR